MTETEQVTTERFVWVRVSDRKDRDGVPMLQIAGGYYPVAEACVIARELDAALLALPVGDDTMTTATEQAITTADLVLLATGVMGWEQVENDWAKGLDDLLPSENHFTVRTHDKFQDAVCRFVDGNLNEFDSTRNTDVGLGQAVRLLEAWWNASACRRASIDYGPPAGDIVTVYLIHDAVGGGRWEASDFTLARAITRAVLAAVKGAA